MISTPININDVVKESVAIKESIKVADKPTVDKSTVEKSVIDKPIKVVNKEKDYQRANIYK
jgi:hypothetical protein